MLTSGVHRFSILLEVTPEFLATSILTIHNRDVSYEPLCFLALLLGTCGLTLGRNSSVGTAIPYGLDGPGIEPWWTGDFSDPSIPAPEAHSVTGGKAAGVCR